MMALGAFFRGGDRTKPATLGWQTTSALVFGVSLVASQQLVLGAAGLAEQTGSLHADGCRRRRWSCSRRSARARSSVVGLLFSVLEARLRRSLRRAETELQRRSFRDGLTGLPNRLMFDGMLAQAVQQADGAHAAAGDPVHRPRRLQAGQRIARPRHRRPRAARDRGAPEALRAPEDRVAHLGGDEYLMLIGADPSAEDAAIFSERLQALDRRAVPDERPRGDGDELDRHRPLSRAGPISALIANAEAAMRSAKSGGGAGYAFFEQRMTSGARDQLELLRDLRRALAAKASSTSSTSRRSTRRAARSPAPRR